ncbi:MAG: hypothetical protein Q9159_006305 [Coniocarpon cinnabarinum]
MPLHSPLQAVIPITFMSAICFLFIKLALLHYYRKIFLVQQRALKITLWLNAIYIILWAVGVFFFYLFTCIPVSYEWERYGSFVSYGNQHAKCIHIQPNPHILSTVLIVGILGLLSDVAIILIPMFMLRTLHMSRKRKFGLILLFSVGWFTVATTIIRLVYQGRLTSDDDTTCHIVRVAPNELSFNGAQSWKDIYDFRPGHRIFVKSNFYENGSFADQCGSFVSERDPENHSRMRRFLSHAFSMKSLAEQEANITAIIDTFIDEVGKRHSLDIGEFYHILTFDVIGSLAFGESFGGLPSGSTHPWIKRTVGALTQGALVECFKRFPILARVMLTFLSGKFDRLVEDTKVNEHFAIELTKKRIESGNTRHDFLTRILEQRDPREVTDIQIAAHASDFVLAGSETTATTLSTITHHIMKHRHILLRLQKEIRREFTSYKDITYLRASNLEYLGAVCLEAMRICPPVPFALPRVVPEPGDTVDGQFIAAGTVVSTAPIAATLDHRNFQDPLDFVPERWLDRTDDVLDASQPFSLGSRACLGRNLGWLEIRLVLAKLLFAYDLERVGEDFDWHTSLKMRTLWVIPHLNVRLRPIEH